MARLLHQLSLRDSGVQQRTPTRNPLFTSSGGGKRPAPQRIWEHKRDLHGPILNTEYRILDDELVGMLSNRYSAISANTDMIGLFLKTFYSEDARQTVEQIVESPLNFGPGIERLSAAGMPIKEAFLLLSLLKYLHCIQFSLAR
jgi:hypothetical protein